MKLHLAATAARLDVIKKANPQPKYILESFYYVTKDQIPLIESGQLCLLDSGAFTFMNSKDKNHDYQKFLDNYIDFINQYDIKYFFELDIDSEIGYENVKELRAKLESRTGKRSIPVFHKCRGLQEWVNMCKEYDYVAIGTMHEYRNKHHILKELLKIARQHKTKVHGLGFTGKKLDEFDFYSVDSTSWTSGRRFGSAYIFTGNSMKTYSKKDCRAIPNVKIDEHNLREWIKYQYYLDRL